MSPSFVQQLAQRAERLAELDFLLAQPDVMADMAQFMALSREHTEVAAVAGRWARHQQRERDLAAAVQVLSYELRCALLDGAGAGVATAEAARTPPPGDGAASHAELEGLFGQLAETLDQIDFHKGRAPESAMRKLRRLYLRANLDAAEIRLLRGVLADAQRMARLAGEASHDGKIG